MPAASTNVEKSPLITDTVSSSTTVLACTFVPWMASPSAVPARPAPQALGQNATVLRAIRADLELHKAQSEASIIALREEFAAYRNEAEGRLKNLEEEGRQRDKALFEMIKGQNAKLLTLEKVLKILTADQGGEESAPGEVVGGSVDVGNPSVVAESAGGNADTNQDAAAKTATIQKVARTSRDIKVCQIIDRRDVSENDLPSTEECRH